MRTLPKWTSRKRRAFCLIGSYLIILWTLLMPMTSIMHVPFFSTWKGKVDGEECPMIQEASYISIQIIHFWTI